MGTPGTGVMTICVTHVTTRRANPYCRNLPEMPIWPSPGLICCFFITELVTRNPNLGIPTPEDGLFANLLIFDIFEFLDLWKVGLMRSLTRTHAH